MSYDEIFAEVSKPASAGASPYDAIYDQVKVKPTPAKIAQTDFAFDPMRDMTMMERALAGAGKSVVDTLRGAGQMVGLASRDDVAESRRLDKPLMDTTAGTVGNIGGDVVTAALMPFGTTLKTAALAGGAYGLTRPSESTTETALNTAIGLVGGAAGQKLGGWLGDLFASRNAKTMAEAQQIAADQAQKVAAARAGQSQGYVIPPADLNPGTVVDALSGLSGKIKTAQTASQKNQAVTNQLVRDELKIAPGAPLNFDATAMIRAKAGQAYEAVKAIGEVTPGAAYTKALDDAIAPFASQSKSFPGRKVNPVVEEINALRTAKFDAGDAIEQVKLLRADADQAYAAKDKIAGKAYKQAAEALEQAIDDQMVANGAPKGLIEAYREARKTIAKTYTVDRAINPVTGDVNAQVLARDLVKQKPLSGNLKDVAEFANAFPKATQSLKEAPKQFSPLDWAVMAATSGGNGLLNIASLGARPLVRQGLLTGPAQSHAISNMATVKGPGLLSRTAETEAARSLYNALPITGGLLAYPYFSQ